MLDANENTLNSVELKDQTKTYCPEGSCSEHLVDKILHQFKQLSLASMGTAALAQDELEKLHQKLVKKGEDVEKEFIDKTNSFFQKSYEQAQNTFEAFSQGWKGPHKILEKMNIPNNSDMNRLAQKVEELSEKLATLEKKQEK